MFAKERHTKILEILKETGSVTTAQLVDVFSVSIETIRRDLLILEDGGMLQRVHGGAVAMEANRGVVTVTMSFSRRLPDKNAVRSVPPMDYAGGMRHSLLELSDILPTDTFVSALY